MRTRNVAHFFMTEARKKKIFRLEGRSNTLF